MAYILVQTNVTAVFGPSEATPPLTYDPIALVSSVIVLYYLIFFRKEEEMHMS